MVGSSVSSDPLEVQTTRLSKQASMSRMSPILSQILGEVPSEVLVHLEHADLVLAIKDRPQLVIRQDLPLVLRVLEIVGLDVLPHLAHHFGAGQGRSEEHTSELQSQSNLVCRLLLEKK